MLNTNYKIYYYKPNDFVTIATIRWFCKNDYIPEHFFKDENGNDLLFNTEKEAIQWLNENIIKNKIDPYYLKFNQKNYMKNI